MRGYSKFFILPALCIALPAMAQPGQCPPREPGTYPWAKNGTMPGDKWAWVYLELDDKARPKGCKLGENNVRNSDLGFYMCRAMERDWEPATPEQAKALASTTVKRFFIMHGPSHSKQMREARKKFFAANPNERPECYPEN